MADQPSVRLNKVLRELNISLDRAVEFLNQKELKLTRVRRQKSLQKCTTHFWMNLKRTNPRK